MKQDDVTKKDWKVVFRNIWLISILVIVVSFIVLFTVNILTGKVYKDFIANIFIFSFILSLTIGGISFLIWIFSLINKRAIEKPSKGKIFRNIWLISILVFIVSSVALVVGAMNNNPSSVGLILIPFLLSIVVGCISFLIWISKLINNKLEKNPNRYISMLIKIFGILVKVFIIFVGLLILLYLFILRPTTLSGTSMEPKFNDQDYLLTEKVSYYTRDPRRGEVVIYTTVIGMDDRIGRIIGLPNETLVIQKGQIGVNGKLLDEPYANWSNWEGKEPSTFKLGGDEYLVLLDKRTSVLTVLSVVKKAQFTGRVFYRYWPLNMAGFISYP